MGLRSVASCSYGEARRKQNMSIFPTKILVATDGSEEAALAAKAATNMANLCRSELHVVHVEQYPPYLLADYGSLAYLDAHLLQTTLEEADRQARNTLDERVSHIEGAGGTVTGSYLRQGRPDREIVDLAEETGAGLIVIGSRGLGGMRRALMGSVSDSVVRHAHCPVMVVRLDKERSADNEADVLT
jgi:nucleotide-binding universal stress UspA family protein